MISQKLSKFISKPAGGGSSKFKVKSFFNFYFIISINSWDIFIRHFSWTGQS